MTLLIIRHGESEADILNVHEGRADFPLTERGHREAEAMADFVSCNYHIDKIYASTLKRAAETAVHLAAKSGLTPIPEERLREFNNGLLAGLPFDEANRRYPRVSGVPVHEGVYEQESRLEFRFRADYILSKIISENAADSTVAIVSHGGMIEQLYRSFLRMPLECTSFFCTSDTGVHEWRITERERLVVHANMTSHTAGL